MLLAGDEFRNTQHGNNNAYCQDNPLSWINWENRERFSDIYEFCKLLIALRRDHPVLRRREYYTDKNSSGYPELSFHGEKPWSLDMWSPFLVFGFMYAEPRKDFGTEKDCFIYCGVNSHWEEHTMELPILPEGMRWHKVAYTGDTVYEPCVNTSNKIRLMSRSLMIMIGM